MQNSQKFNVLKVVAYLELVLLFVAYCLTLNFVGIVPGLIVTLVVHFLIGQMEKSGMTTTTKTLLWVIVSIKIGQVWLHVNSFQKGLEFADAHLPFDWDFNDGAWYLAAMLLVIDLFSLYAIGRKKQDEKEEAETAAEAERANDFVKNQAEAERNKMELARMEHERKMAELATQNAQNQSVIDRFRAEKEAETEAAIKLAEAEAERERKRRAEQRAELEAQNARQTGTEKRNQVPQKTARRAELDSAIPATSGGSSDDFFVEMQRAIMELDAEGKRNPTQKEIGARMVWRNVKGVSDKTIRNYQRQSQ